MEQPFQDLMTELVVILEKDNHMDLQQEINHAIRYHNDTGYDCVEVTTQHVAWGANQLIHSYTATLQFSSRDYGD